MKTQPTMFDIIAKIRKPDPTYYRPSEKQDTEWILYDDPLFLELAAPPLVNQVLDLVIRVVTGRRIWKYAITDECGIVSRHILLEFARRAIPKDPGQYAIHAMRYC